MTSTNAPATNAPATNVQRLAVALGAGLQYTLMIFVIAISLGPFVWVILSTFKSNRQVLDSALSLPSRLSFAAYANAIERSNFLLFFYNSLFVSVMATVVAILVFGMAAYVLARFEFPGKNLIYGLLVSTLLVSLIPMQQPILTVVQFLHLYDTKWALILVYSAKGLPIVIFIMVSFFKSIPKEMEEAAYLEGASFFQTYIRIMLPLARPAMASSAVLIFLNSWNEFLFALLLTQSESNRTLALALRFFTNMFAYDFPTLFAAVVMTLLPSILIYILLQEQIHKSLAAGAVKG